MKGFRFLAQEFTKAVAELRPDKSYAKSLKVDGEAEEFVVRPIVTTYWEITKWMYRLKKHVSQKSGRNPDVALAWLQEAEPPGMPVGEGRKGELFDVLKDLEDIEGYHNLNTKLASAIKKKLEDAAKNLRVSKKKLQDAARVLVAKRKSLATAAPGRDAQYEHQAVEDAEQDLQRLKRAVAIKLKVLSAILGTCLGNK